LALLLLQNQVHDPTTAHMLAGLPAMIQDVGVIAAGVFEKWPVVDQLPFGTHGLPIHAGLE
jgi:hypothetical protein